jgi:hypothetical protein
MKRYYLIPLILFTFNLSAQQTGSCNAGTQYCEANSLNTTNVTTTNNTNSNTNTNTNTSTSTATSNNTNINTSTNTNNNTNNNTSTSTSTNTNNNNNVNTNTSTVTQNSTVNQNVNNTTTSTNTNINQNNNVSQNTNINQSTSESNVTTDNTNTNFNNNVNNSTSDNTNRNINESTSTQNINQTVKTKAPPASAIAPSIMSYSQDLCTTGVSGAFQGQVFGFSGGKTIVDQNCERLKLSKYLYDMGMKVASVALLCQDERVFKAMTMAGTPCPYNGKIGEEAKAAWKQNPQKRPDKDDALNDFIKQCTKEPNPQRKKINKDVVGVIQVIYTRKTKTDKQCKKEFYGE